MIRRATSKILIILQGFSFRLVSRTLNPSSKDLDDNLVHVTLQKFLAHPRAIPPTCGKYT